MEIVSGEEEKVSPLNDTKMKKWIQRMNNKEVSMIKKLRI